MTSYKYQNPKSFSANVEHCVYTEYDKEKNKTFSCQLRHEQSVRIVTDENGRYEEWDKHNRCTFSTDKDNFWYLRFYDENPMNKTPYQVVHHSWHLYNGLERKPIKRVFKEISAYDNTVEMQHISEIPYYKINVCKKHSHYEAQCIAVFILNVFVVIKSKLKNLFGRFK